MLISLGENADHRNVLFAQQDCFTPSSIRRDTVLRTDRPFAAALYLGERSISTDTERKRTLISSFSLGVLGPCALCAEEQVGLHRALNNIAPLGWQYQVAGDVILNYGAQFDQRLLKNDFAEIAAGIGAEADTYRTNANVHARLELGRFNSAFDAPTGSFRAFQASAFLAGQANVVGYDATCQGGVFDRDSPHVLSAPSLLRMVLRGEVGVHLRYHSFALLYSKTFTTREFRTGLDHGWGSIDIMIFF